MASQQQHMAGAVRSISDFQTTNMLGKGSMGHVWHAYRMNTKEAYAIKAIAKTNATAIARVVEERTILTLVDSPFIVRMYWAFQDDSHVYFVLQHAKGGDLMSVMRNFHAGGMSEDHSRFYIAEILLALEYLHEMNIVVRDLKPANCLTTGSGHIVLADFSHSTRLLGTRQFPKTGCSVPDVSNDEPSSDDRSDGTGCLGTPEYMAPETLHEQDTTKLVDYWSLGIILFELLFAHLPWGSCDDTQVADLFFSIMTQPVCFIDDEGERGVSVAAKALITGLLDKDPSRRMGADVADVKTHRFFNQPGEELDWAAARRGELVPPPREIPTVEDNNSEPEPGRHQPRRGSPVQWLRIRPFANRTTNSAAQ